VVGRAGAARVFLTLLVASATACQALVAVGDYDFEPAREESRPLSDPSDASAGLDASPGADASAATPDASAAAQQPDAAPPPSCRGPRCLIDTCAGCLVAGRCVPAGQALPSNPCLVCDPEQSVSGYSIAVGNACGAEASACSAPDRCDADGFCAPHDLPEGTPCADASGAACDVADTCDGAGACVDRRADDGTPCDDGQFCTTNDQCLGAQCVAGGPRQCAENEQCVEDADACECAGCAVDGACLPRGARDGRPCFVCDPERSRTALSPEEGVVCGDPDGECFGARTCDANGDCRSRPLGVGAACGSPLGSDCSGPDGCDGNGSCSPNDASDGTPCEDGLFCTESDSCQGGACFSGDPVLCANGLECNENDGCACPSGFVECPDGTCRRRCGDFEIP
jgi:hypothetical protein